ncbi:uncharacterized protein LOC134843725 [Symsagittifera roscoffensis]|uniref:uncharacterized protein LOC134843725 n=1 Tax=Symsagittifera roscoffensis TaxID=84072 RepID=UPI00307B598F
MGWVRARDAIKLAPLASGLYRLGMYRKWGQIEVIYIGVTSTGGSIRETLTKLFLGLDGDPNLMLYVSPLWTKGNLFVDWTVRLYPKTDINDVIRLQVKSTRRVPLFNQRSSEKDPVLPYVARECNMHNPQLFH